MKAMMLRFIEPKNNISDKDKLFSNAQLKAIIIPLVIEQGITMLMAMINIMMITQAGVSAVSGVSLVEMINALFILVFGALTTGGAVVVAQYVGNKNIESGRNAASQLTMITTLSGIIFMIIGFVFAEPILKIVYKSVDPDVMNASITYFKFSAVSYPFLAIYNACSALFRATGKSKTVMNIALLMNGLNILGNIIWIFVLQAGVFGVSMAALIARGVAAILFLYLAFDNKNEIHLEIKRIFSFNKEIIRNMLKVAVPNGVENGIFQISKIVLTSIISTFGTIQIAANGIGTSIIGLCATVGLGTSLATITVVGQCIGANQYEQAVYYIKKIIRISILFSFILDVIVMALMPLIIKLYSLPEEGVVIVFILVAIHNVFMVGIWSDAFVIPNGLRAAGDAKYTMVIGTIAMVVVRVGLTIVLGVYCNLAAIGLMLAMCLDWVFRAVVYRKRLKGTAWQSYRVIN